MNREIKFRAWDKNKKSYRDQQNLLNDICRFHREDGSYNDVNLLRFVLMVPQQDNFILEQWTGLKDKNGKDIYEGDIVSGKDHYDIGEVKWDIYKDDEYVDGLETWMIKMPFEAPLSSTIKFPYYSGWNSRGPLVGPIEVIGNIHENAELLDSKPNKD